MFDPFTLALFGGAVGGLLDKKDPLRGAALGAAGGYFAPGLLGGTAAGSAAGTDAIGHFAAAEAAGNPITMSEASLMAGGMNPANIAPTNGLFGPALGSQAEAGLKAVKPYAEAAQSAGQVAGMFKQPEQAPIQPSPFMQPNTPSMPMNNLVAQLNQGQQFRQQADMQRRARRQSLIG